MSVSLYRHAAQLLVGAVFVAGCWVENEEGSTSLIVPTECEDLDCDDLLRIYIERRDGEPFIPGSYGFELFINADDPIVLECQLATTFSLDCAGDEHQASIGIDEDAETFTVRLDATPSQLLVTVYFETEEIANTLVDPSYQNVTANDPACMESCIEGNATVTTTSPPE